MVLCRVMHKPHMNKEHCAVLSDLVCNLNIGDQVRVRFGAEQAVFTVKWLTSGEEHVQLNMNRFTHLNHVQDKHLTVHLSGPTVVHTGLTPEQAEQQSEFVEQVCENGLEWIAIAPHGGNIEVKTDLQVDYFKAQVPGASSWVCKGYQEGGGAFRAWHTTSTDINPNSFPGLARISANGQRFKRCVAFHGLSAGGVLIGGNAPLEEKLLLQKLIEQELDDAKVQVRIATLMDHCNGMAPKNVCNWLTENQRGGIQLEQDRYVRIKHWRQMADAVVKFAQASAML